MGTNFSLCDANWSSEGYRIFLIKVASQIWIDRETLCNLAFYGNWHDLCDSIKPLLKSKELEYEDCATASLRLKQILKDWDDSDLDKISGLRLINKLDEAAKLRKKLRIITNG